MAANPYIYNLTQLGVEVTAGTAVAATKRFTTLEWTPSIRPEVDTYRASGYKFPTVAALSKEWGEWSFSGPLTYTEAIYIFSSLIKVATPSGAGADKTWVFDPNSTASDTRKTYTLEHGNSTYAVESAYTLVSGCTLEFSRDAVTMSGTAISKALTEEITMTTLTSAAEIAVVPVLPTQVTVKFADAQSGLAGASALSLPFAATWQMENVSGPVWPLNGSTSFAEMVDTVPTVTGSVRLAVDAAGMALLDNLRDGSTKFMRIGATGATLGGSNYGLTLDVAMKITDPREFRDEAGVYAVEWGYEITHDSTWGKGTSLTLVSSLTTL